jgi:hypothetical protein
VHPGPLVLCIYCCAFRPRNLIQHLANEAYELIYLQKAVFLSLDGFVVAGVKRFPVFC